MKITEVRGSNPDSLKIYWGEDEVISLTNDATFLGFVDAYTIVDLLGCAFRAGRDRKDLIIERKDGEEVFEKMEFKQENKLPFGFINFS